jgi:hypothetical protein
MNIELLQNDGDNDPIELGVLYNFTVFPRVKEKIAYNDKIYEVEDLIWHTDDNKISVTLWLDLYA